MLKIMTKKTWNRIQGRLKKQEKNIDDLWIKVDRKNNEIATLESLLVQQDEKYLKVLNEVTPKIPLYSNTPDVSVDMYRTIITILPVSKYHEMFLIGDWFMYVSEKDLDYIADEMLEYSRENVRKAYREGIQEIIKQKFRNEGGMIDKH